MPSRSRREERHLEAPRFESEMRVSDLQKFGAKSSGKKMFRCEKCMGLFEERSITCPRCEKKTMGELEQLPGKDIERFNGQSIDRIRRGL